MHLLISLRKCHIKVALIDPTSLGNSHSNKSVLPLKEIKMSDQAQQDIDVSEGGEGAEGGENKKKGGMGSLLPNLLKFIALGLGALIFIVTVCIITYNIMNKGGKSQTLQGQSDSYVATKPVYSIYTTLDEVSTRTADKEPYIVVVKINLAYTQNDNAAANEFTDRRYELQDWLRKYFASKRADELRPANEESIKTDIREQINNNVLDKARVRSILFDKLDIMQM
jgi:flagellar FliL protein